MNRVLSLWVGVPAVRLALVLGGARVASAATDDGSGRPRRAPALRIARRRSSRPGVRLRTRPRRRSTSAPRARRSSRCRTARRPRCRSTRRWKTSRRATSRSSIGNRRRVRCSPASRDERQSALKQRALALLVTEIQRLERCFDATENTSPDRPQAPPPSRRGLRRARERGVPREDRTPRSRATPPRRANPREAQKQQSIANSRKTTLERSRKAAIRYYSMLVDDYSGQPSTTFQQNPPPAYPELDEVYYYLAYEYEQAGDTRQRAPRLPRAHHRRRRSRSTSRTRTSRSASSSSTRRRATRRSGSSAKQAYQKVITYPPPDNKVYGYAWYKLALRLLEQGRLRPRARRVQEDDRLRRPVRAAPEREEARRERPARTSSRSTRSRATRPRRTTSSSTSAATQRGRPTRRSR